MHQFLKSQFKKHILKLYLFELIQKIVSINKAYLIGALELFFYGLGCNS